MRIKICKVIQISFLSLQQRYNLNLSLYISGKLLKSKKGSFTSTVTKIAIGSIAIGLVILIVSYGVLKGFNSEIKNKIFSLSGHLQINRTSTQNTLEDTPLTINTLLYKKQDSISSIKALQSYIRKPCIMKTKEGVQGVVLKGLSQDYYKSAINKNIIKGKMFVHNDTTFSKEVVLSKKLSDKMRVDVGESFLFYFIQNPPKFRKVVVSGIYETGLEELDSRFVLCDLKLIQGINKWDDTLVGGYEIFVNNFDKLDESSLQIYNEMDYKLSLTSVKDKFAQIFDWFKLLNQNVQMLMFFIFFIVCINVATSFIIIILDKVKFIGTLKALGATNRQIRSVFLWNGIKIMIYGVLIGNVVGITLCVIQDQFHLIPLDAANYYISYVPISLNFEKIFFVNITLCFVIAISLLFPVWIISRVSPIRSIRMK